MVNLITGQGDFSSDPEIERHIGLLLTSSHATAQGLMSKDGALVNHIQAAERTLQAATKNQPKTVKPPLKKQLLRAGAVGAAAILAACTSVAPGIPGTNTPTPTSVSVDKPTVEPTPQPEATSTAEPTETPVPSLISRLEEEGFQIIKQSSESFIIVKDRLTFHLSVLGSTDGPEIASEIDPIQVLSNIQARFEYSRPVSIELRFDAQAQRYYYRIRDGVLLDKLSDGEEYKEGDCLFPLTNAIVPASLFANADLLRWAPTDENTLEQVRLEAEPAEDPDREPTYWLVVTHLAGPPDWAWQEPAEAITYPVSEEEIERLGLEVETVEAEAEAEEAETSEYLIGSENLTDEIKEANNFKEEQRPITNGKTTIRILRHPDLTDNLPFEFNEEVMTEEEFVSAVVDRWSLTQAKMFDQEEQVHINAIDWGWMMQEWDQLEGEPRLPRANVADPETDQRKMEWLIQAFPYAIDEFEHITLIEMPARPAPNQDFSRDERTILGPDGEPVQVGLLNRGGFELPGYFGTMVNIRPDGTKELIVIEFDSKYGDPSNRNLLSPIDLKNNELEKYAQVARIRDLINNSNNNIKYSCMPKETFEKELAWQAMSDASLHMNITLLRKYGSDTSGAKFFLKFFGTDEYPITKHLFVFETN
ncbi:hypothetical protein [Vibrio sp.]|uniref:hypothetical protein n=1 Tax=Vibrio sp. TaxID=678 RepID=UPI003D0BB377